MDVPKDESNQLPRGEDGQSSAAAKAQLKERILKLPSTQQQDRVYATYSDFGDVSFDIVGFFDGKKVPGQWKKFTDDVAAVNDPDDTMYSYNKSLSNAFGLKSPTDMFDIITTTKKLRAEHKLPPLSPSVTKDALADFGRVFLFEKETDEHGVISFTPVIRKHYT